MDLLIPVVRWFRQMSGTFELCVGSDLLAKNNADRILLRSATSADFSASAVVVPLGNFLIMTTWTTSTQMRYTNARINCQRYTRKK